MMLLGINLRQSFGTSPIAHSMADKTPEGKTHMDGSAEKRQTFNIFIIAQAGRLEYEALLFATSLKASNPDFKGRLIIGVPQGKLWQRKTELTPVIAEALTGLGGEITHFTSEHFGQTYPPGNKIEGLKKSWQILNH